MNVIRMCLTVAGVVAVAVCWTGAAVAGPAASRPDPQELRALMIRSEALNRLYGDQGQGTFVPGVTDFPARPAMSVVTVSAVEPGGFDWSDAGIGAGSGAVALLLAAGAVAALRRGRRGILGTAGAVVALVAVALGSPGIARGDAVTDWNVHATNAILAPGPTAHASVLSWAMVQGAVYDAVNAIDGGHQRYLARPPANPWDSKDAAAATAAYRVLVDLFPAQQAVLQQHYETSLAAVPDGPMKQGGIAAGEAAAAVMLAARVNDGRGGPFTFVIGQGPGDWRPLTPTALDPAAWVGNVRPFLIESPSQFRSEGPNPITGAAYAEEFNEVKEIGSLTSTTRTADQTRAAIFWQAQPTAVWGGLLRSLSARRGLDIAENARLFAMVSLAAADGSISCWNDKYYWNFWRPMAAIREAATDGNPATEADPAWKPLFDPSTQTVPALVTPPFPDHPSGHGCVSGAVLHTARNFFGTDKVAFDVFSSRFPGQPRHFGRFSEALKEIIDARVWGGIHFRTADVQGAVMGKKVAQYLQKHYFQPVD